MAKAPQSNATTAPAVSAPAVRVESKAKVVTVASKLPMNIELQLCNETTARMTGQFGSVQEKVFVKTGAVYVIRGNAYPNGQVPKGFPKRPGLIEDDHGGYALTPNVPADWFAKWLEQNADTDMVRNGLIKAHASMDDLEVVARENEKVDSGLGPMNPDGDRRDPQPASTQVQVVKPESRAAA